METSILSNVQEIETACKLVHVARSAYHNRRINDDLRHDYGIHVNDKRVLRICLAGDIKSTIKYENRGCTRRAKNPPYIAENLLNRQFYADKPNEKRLADVTSSSGMRRIVSYVLSGRNDNPLVCKTFDQAVKANPGARPQFHSDRGFQYTGRAFHHKLLGAGMTQSMSRVSHCMDNGLMEGFCGILRRERLLRQTLYQQAAVDPDD